MQTIGKTLYFLIMNVVITYRGHVFQNLVVSWGTQKYLLIQAIFNTKNKIIAFFVFCSDDTNRLD